MVLSAVSMSVMYVISSWYVLVMRIRCFLESFHSLRPLLHFPTRIFSTPLHYDIKLSHPVLARYATSNAVYRELLQNSNDAGAKQAEIRFTTTAANVNVSEDGTSSSSSAAAAAAAAAGVSVRKSSGTTFDANNNSKACKRPLVTKALYRNDGMPFRKEDWARLSKIAEGNPDPSKVGAFGVGAYTMFSVAEQPMVISSGQMLEFIWKGDALWTRVGPVPSELQQSLDAIDARGENPSTKWTTFVLARQSRFICSPLVDIAGSVSGIVADLYQVIANYPRLRR